jgi:hypothetical protein
MTTVMKMRWEGITPDQYDQMRKLVDWDNDVPQGAVHHVAWFTDGGVNVIDLWESADDFNRFVEQRLMPSVAEAGVEGEPNIELHEAHAVFAPLEK